jgi:Spy/CpxP family protein refolding chaperone
MKIAAKAAILAIALVSLASHAHAGPSASAAADLKDREQSPSQTATGRGCLSMRKPGPPPFSALRLSDEQLELMHTIREKHAENLIPKMAELMRLKHKQMDLITALSYDKLTVKELQTKINALQSEVADEHLSIMLESDAVLNADQKKELRHMILMHEPPFGPPGPMGGIGMGRGGPRPEPMLGPMFAPMPGPFGPPMGPPAMPGPCLEPALEGPEAMSGLPGQELSQCHKSELNPSQGQFGPVGALGFHMTDQFSNGEPGDRSPDLSL